MFYESRHRFRRIIRASRTRALDTLIPGRAERSLVRVLASITRDAAERAEYLRRCSPWWTRSQARVTVLASIVSSVVSAVIARAAG